MVAVWWLWKKLALSWTLLLLSKNARIYLFNHRVGLFVWRSASNMTKDLKQFPKCVTFSTWSALKTYPDYRTSRLRLKWWCSCKSPEGCCCARKGIKGSRQSGLYSPPNFEQIAWLKRLKLTQVQGLEEAVSNGRRWGHGSLRNISGFLRRGRVSQQSVPRPADGTL